MDYSECTPTSHHETLLTCYIRQASISYRHRLHLQVHCFSSKMVVSAVCILVAVTAVHLLSACDTGSLRARVLEKVGALVSPPPRLTRNHNRCHLAIALCSLHKVVGGAGWRTWRHFDFRRWRLATSPANKMAAWWQSAGPRWRIFCADGSARR